MDNNFHQDLHIRPVEENDVDQFNELLSYVFKSLSRTSRKAVMKASVK